MKLWDGRIMEKRELIAVVGPNGSGKSRLVNSILGNGNIRCIAFRDAFSLTGADYYHQQRWNSMDAEDSPTVMELLYRNHPAEVVRDHVGELFSALGIASLSEKRTVMLSSGELRKLQIASALLARPEVLVIDNPYAGLDAGARDVMNSLLEKVAAKGETGIILILSRESDIPSFITTVVRVGTAQRAGLDDKSRNAILSLPEASGDYHAEVVAELRNVSISYGGRKILDGVDWKIRNGEKWALCGRNGCGKSTLLSLICADNPQAYACDITLFDRKRGSGESIWDIKKHIGYVSPEMYRAYLQHVPAGEIVASGFTDIVGICRKPDPEQLSSARFWMNIFGIGDLEDRFFTELSSGEQHLCLLARAFVKDPEFLILDEPLHCLDDGNSALAKDVISTFCRRKNKTLVMVSHYTENFPDIIDRKFELP